MGWCAATASASRPVEANAVPALSARAVCASRTERANKGTISKEQGGYMLVKTVVLMLLTSALSLESAAQSASNSGATHSRSAKAQAVTINIPEGMSKDQADAILAELKQIRQLLEKQQTIRAAVPA